MNLRFKTLAISAYAAIDRETKATIEAPASPALKIDEEQLKNADPENGLMIVFPEGYPLMVSEGNQGVGKTSLLSALYEVCGGDAPKNVVNTKEHDKKLSAEFIGKDGQLYHLRLTKTGISLDRIVTDENGEVLLDQKGKEQKVKVASPKTMLAELVGPAGVSPQWLRDKDGKGQIEWLRSIMVASQEVVKFEGEVLPKLKKAEADRKAKKAEHKTLQTVLSTNDFYQNYEQWVAYFAKAVDLVKIEAKLKAATEKVTEYQKYENAVTVYTSRAQMAKEQQERINEQIRLLQAQLVEQEQAEKEANEKVEKANKYLLDNKSVKEEYQAAVKEKEEAAQVESNKKSFEQMELNKKQMDQASDEVIRLEGLVDEYRELKKKMVADFTPNVEGLEVCVPDDVEETREGLFYLGHPLNQLSESELWQMATALWQEMNIKVVLVENITSLGTGAVEQFNAFINNGGYVFATQMNRKQPNLKITWNTKIPD